MSLCPMKKSALLISLIASFLVSCKQEVFYNITAEAQPDKGGCVVMTPSSGPLLEGSSVSFLAEPNGDYVFSGWSGSLSGSQNPITVVVTTDLNVVANFTLRMYSLTVTTEGEGSVTERVISTKSDYSSGTVVELTALPSDHWAFDHWDGLADAQTNPAIITINEAMAVKAVFVEQVSEQDTIIEFNDSEVKRIVVSKFDADRDGQLSYGEAAAVKDLGYVFYRNTKVKSFDELRFFTGLTKVGEFAFSECTNLSSIILPDGITSIDQYAFQLCKALLSIDLPDSISTIGEGAFLSCENLTSIVIPNNVSRIEKNTFYNCFGLESVSIPEGLKSVGNYAFFACTKLASISLPDSVSSIEECAFGCCEKLVSFDVPKSLTNIDVFVFTNCLSLESISLPEGITSIGSSAFSGCANLVSLNLPTSLKRIDDHAFTI